MFELIMFSILLVVAVLAAVVVGPKIHKALSKVANVHLFYLGLLIIITYGAMNILSEASVSLPAFSDAPTQRTDNPLARTTSASEVIVVYVLYVGAAMLPLSFVDKLFDLLSKKQQNDDVK
ncbi:hypothetical protein [Edaphovirga cremea]|uniref:hypothetical protein n=1 Tax=Edaphovirga cremea TaxID=2267246 RepID=UPI00398A3B1A